MAEVESDRNPSVKVEEEDDDDDEDLFGGDDDDEENSPLPPSSNIVKEEDQMAASLPAQTPVDETQKEGSIKALGIEKQPQQQLSVPIVENMSTASVATTTKTEPADTGALVVPQHTPPLSHFSADTESVTEQRPVRSSGDDEIPIPRKSNFHSSQAMLQELSSPAAVSSSASVSAPAASTSQIPTKTYSGIRFGLSPSVKIPESVDPKLLEGSILTKLKSLPTNLANDALQEYDDALQIKGTSIRNRGAYLFGVIKRYVSVQARANSGEGPAILPMGEGLTPLVNARLETLVQSGFCSREEMNDKVKCKIRMLSEKDALFAIDELSSAERSTIRNFGSYFMGILNRYMRGDTNARANEPPPPATFSSSSSNRTNRFDRPHGSVPHDRSFRDSSNRNPPVRDRSRDRQQENDRFGPYGGGNQSHVGIPQRAHDPYAAAKNPGRWQQHPQQQPLGGYNNLGNTMGTSQPPPPPPPNMGHLNNPYMAQQQHPVPQTPYGMHQPQQPPPNPYGGNHQGYGPLGDNRQQHPNGGPPMYNNSSMPQQNNGYQQQSMMSGQQQSYNSNIRGHQQQQPNQFVPQQQSFNQLGGQNHMPPQQHQPPPQSASYGSWQQQQQHHQHQSQVPMDILALADKASSALLAVTQQQSNMNGVVHQSHPYASSSIPNHHAPAPPPPPPAFNSMHPNRYPPSGQQQQQQHPPAGNNQRSNNAPTTTAAPTNRPPRHTTATIQDLPTSVQYAVQNLVATGQVEKSPDEGIMGMIYDLPESLALSALQKFTTIDKTGMRSRIAYLAGVLRRELEKINKR